MALIRRIRVVWTGVAGSPAYSNFYFVNGSGSPQSQAANVRQVLANLAGIVVDGVTATIDPDAALIDSVTGEIQGVEGVTVEPVEMLNGSEPLPPATQVLVRLGTGTYVAGRQLRGRWYIPYPGSSLSEDGSLSPVTRQDIDNIVNPLIVSSGGGWVIWSRTTGATSPVLTVNTWDQFGVMRSRRD